MQSTQLRVKGFLPRRRLVGGSGLINALFTASILTGANWYIQNKWAQGKMAKDDQIIGRINRGETTSLEEIKEITNELEAQNLEGKKLSVTGQIQPGRFVVRKKKGNQDGYAILAPYIVEAQWNSASSKAKPQHTKFMLSLGWIPKTFKHRIREASSIDIIPLNDLPDHLLDQTDSTIPITSTINAYVRKGEEEDKFNSSYNDPKSQVYQFIDLNLMANAFGNVNHNSRLIYLDRTVEEGEADSFPFPKTSQELKEELERRKAGYQHTKNVMTATVGVLSYLSALLLA